MQGGIGVTAAFESGCWTAALVQRLGAVNLQVLETDALEVAGAGNRNLASLVRSTQQQPNTQLTGCIPQGRPECQRQHNQSQASQAICSSPSPNRSQS